MVISTSTCFSAGFVEVVMGAHNIRINEASQVSMISRDFFVHEHWNSFLLTNDISMIRLPSPVTFNGKYINTTIYSNSYKHLIICKRVFLQLFGTYIEISV